MKVTSPSNIMLIACGSFSPPTPMHLRMFEIAKDHFHQLGAGQVIGGIVSPVHDAYGKQDLISSTHRIAMLNLALGSSDWIKVSEWECQQQEWTRTRATLQYHQNTINTFIKEINGNVNKQSAQAWLPENLKQCTGNVQLKLLCGADLLESFSKPGLWKDEDIEAIIGQHGIVVVSRSGSNPEQFIFNSDLLSKYRRNITIVTNWVANDVSSTLVRRFFRRNLSVKYLLDDQIIDYVKRNGLYGCNETKYIDTVNNNNNTQNVTTIDDIINANVSPPTVSDDDEYEVAHNDESFVQTHIEITNQLHNYEDMDETDTTTNNDDTVVSDSLPASYKVFCCGETYNPRSPLLNRPGGAVKIITKLTTGGGDEVRNIVKKEETANDQRKVSLPEEGCGGDGLKAHKQSNLHHRLKDKKNICNLSLSAPSTSSHVGENGGRVSPAKSYDEMIQFVFTEHGIKVISDKEYVV